MGVTAIASGAIFCILTFSLKNFFAGLWKPGSLVIVKDNLRSVLRPAHALKLARMVHAMLALHSAKHNATLRQQLEASNSDRKSIVGSLLPARISPLDSLPMPAPLAARPPSASDAPPDPEPREEIRIGIVDSRAPPEGPDPLTNAGRAARDRAAVCAVAMRLLQECEQLQRAMRDLPPSDGFAIIGSLAAQIRDAHEKALAAIHAAIAIANLTHSSVDSFFWKAYLSIRVPLTETDAVIHRCRPALTSPLCRSWFDRRSGSGAVCATLYKPLHRPLSHLDLPSALIT